MTFMNVDNPSKNIFKLSTYAIKTTCFNMLKQLSLDVFQRETEPCITAGGQAAAQAWDRRLLNGDEMHALSGQA